MPVPFGKLRAGSRLRRASLGMTERGTRAFHISECNPAPVADPGSGGAPGVPIRESAPKKEPSLSLIR
jgi:hypothetical protein